MGVYGAAGAGLRAVHLGYRLHGARLRRARDENETLKSKFDDLKLVDESAAIKYTGKSSAPILRNFEILKESGIPFVVRVPLIPKVTDTEENLTAIAERIGGGAF